MENTEPKYRILISNYLSNQATDKEKTVLLEWLEKSEENKKLFTEYRKVFDLSAGAIYKGKFSSKKQNAWKNINEKIEFSVIEEDRKHSFRFFYYFKIAAAAILIFSIGVISSLFLSRTNTNQNLSNIEHEIIVPLGGKSELILPDGSKVWLNAGTHFRYRGDFGVDNRDVYLEGEGYFAVIKNPDKPFIVHASDLKIKAFGTSFNVKAYPEEKFVTTTLEEGIVKIEGKGVNVSLNPKEVVTLQKEVSKVISYDTTRVTYTPQDKSINQFKNKEEESSLLNKNIQVQSDVNTNIYTSWKDNLWIIQSESLKDIAVIIERKFNVTINIESPELNQYTFTGTFNKETLEQILNVIKLTAPLDYKINEGVVIIKAVQKRKSLYNNF